jgi:hypothetical protein
VSVLRCGAGCVWSLWLALILVDAWFITHYASALPWLDDWHHYHLLLREQPWTAADLWALHNEHRIVLPRLVALTVLPLAGYDPRVLMAISLALLALAAALLQRAAARLRGHSSPLDLLIPASLLHPGHAENLLWGFQVQFTLSTLLVASTLAALARRPTRELPTNSSLTATLCVPLLSLCGANGLAFALPLALWLIVVALRGQVGRPRWLVRLAALAAGLLTLAVIVLYCKDYTTPPHHPTTHDPIRIGYTLLNFLSMSVGLIGGLALPPVPGLLACVAIGWGVARLLRQQVWSDPVTSGLLAWIGGLVLLAAGTAYGRAGFAGAAGIACRYVTLTCLLVIWLHLLRLRTAAPPLPPPAASPTTAEATPSAALDTAPPAAPRRRHRAGAVVVILGLLVANGIAGWQYARGWREWFAVVESRLANTPRSFVPDALVWTLGGGDGHVFRRSVLRLVDWGVGPLANVPPDPRLRRLSVPTTQLWLDNVQRLGNTYRPRDQTGGRIVIPIPPGTTARGLLLLGQLTDGHCLVLNDAADTDPLESTTQPTEYRLWLSEAREAVWLELQHGQLAIERIILLVD